MQVYVLTRFNEGAVTGIFSDINTAVSYVESEVGDTTPFVYNGESASNGNYVISGLTVLDDAAALIEQRRRDEHARALYKALDKLTPTELQVLRTLSDEEWERITVGQEKEREIE